MAPDSPRSPLPFEPNRKRKKSSSDKAEATSSAPAASGGQTQPSSKPSPRKAATPKAKGGVKTRDASASTAIPEVVSRRMLRRMMFFSGVPTGTAVFIFFVSYVLITQDIAMLPNYAVLFATLGCFGLGVVGLSYGALSASWDEQRLGSLVGLDEFRLNFGRLTGAWQASRDESGS